MAVENPTTTISIGELYGRQKVANITLEDAKFWGRPNFAGEVDRFKDNRRKFTVLIPNELADQLRGLGWNVRTKLPTPEDLEKDPETSPISSLKVYLNFKIPEDKAHLPNAMDYETGPDVFIKQGEDIEKLTSRTVGLLDRARIENMDMELRAWMYNQEEVDDGLEEPQYSARLVALVATLRPSILDDKYGHLR